MALEGPVFRTMPAAELVPLLPRLRVLARSSPEDKLTLVGCGSKACWASISHRCQCRASSALGT